MILSFKVYKVLLFSHPKDSDGSSPHTKHNLGSSLHPFTPNTIGLDVWIIRWMTLMDRLLYLLVSSLKGTEVLENEKWKYFVLSFSLELKWKYISNFFHHNFLTFFKIDLIFFRNFENAKILFSMFLKTVLLCLPSSIYHNYSLHESSIFRE